MGPGGLFCFFIVLLVFLEWARDEHIQDWTGWSQERCDWVILDGSVIHWTNNIGYLAIGSGRLAQWPRPQPLGCLNLDSAPD